MSAIVNQIAEKTVLQKEARRFKGKTIYHSDIVRKSQSNSVIRNRLFGAEGESVDGGRSVQLTKNTSFVTMLHYIGPEASGGMHKVSAGYKTIIVNTGILFVSTHGETRGESLRLNAGHMFNVESGVTYSFSTGNTEAEILIIESADFKQRTIRKATAPQTGLEQFTAIKTGVDIADIKKRKPMSQEDRDELGRQLDTSRGVISPSNKRNISKDIARGNPMAPSDAVGVNPRPIGDIGDNYLPTE